MTNEEFIEYVRHLEASLGVEDEVARALRRFLDERIQRAVDRFVREVMEPVALAIACDEEEDHGRSGE